MESTIIQCRCSDYNDNLYFINNKERKEKALICCAYLNPLKMKFVDRVKEIFCKMHGFKIATLFDSDTVKKAKSVFSEFNIDIEFIKEDDDFFPEYSISTIFDKKYTLTLKEKILFLFKQIIFKTIIFDIDYDIQNSYIVK